MQQPTQSSPIKIDSIECFIKAISGRICEDNEVLFYRGHSNEKSEFIPSIARKKGWIENEDVMYNELLSSNPDEFRADLSTFEKLVRMRHYSLPTRLLDITSNPLIALYFACEKTPDKDGEVISIKVKKTEVKFSDSDTVSCIANLARLTAGERDKIAKKATRCIASFRSLAKKKGSEIKSEIDKIINKTGEKLAAKPRSAIKKFSEILIQLADEQRKDIASQIESHDIILAVLSRHHREKILGTIIKYCKIATRLTKEQQIRELSQTFSFYGAPISGLATPEQRENCFHFIGKYSEFLARFPEELRNDVLSILHFFSLFPTKAIQKINAKKVAADMGAFFPDFEKFSESQRTEIFKFSCSGEISFKGHSTQVKDAIIAYSLLLSNLDIDLRQELIDVIKSCSATLADTEPSQRSIIVRFIAGSCGILVKLEPAQRKNVIRATSQYIASLAGIKDKQRREKMATIIIGKLKESIEKKKEAEIKESFVGCGCVGRLVHFIKGEKPFFINCIAPHDLRRIVCVRPKMSNSRIAAQSGAFLLFGQALKLTTRTAKGIVLGEKLIISANRKREIKEQLNSLNINQFTVYPQIDKASEMISEKYRG